jgi:flagellar motility protein MotE (MotC chaperone)
MSRWLREFRLVPIVLIAAGALFALKAMGLMFDGGYTLAQRLGRTDTVVVTTVPLNAPTQLRPQTVPLDIASPQGPVVRPWMQEMFNYPDVTGSVQAPRGNDVMVVTGSVAKPTPSATPAKPGDAGPPPAAGAPETKVAAPPRGAAEPPRPTSPAERALLERLQDRRQELDARARELDMRETLLKAAEQKLESRAAELKALEARLGAGAAKKEEADAARLKGLVTMYETMKPREAAKIFDRLDMKVLLDVATKINPRRMSEIMAQMSPEAAEKLTVELASRLNPSERVVSPSDLPKIEGRPTGG